MNNQGRIMLKSSPGGDMSPEDGVVLGRALAMDRRRVVVARDLTRSSAMMAEAVTAGLLSQGADVMDVGAVSMPAASRCARFGDCVVYVAGRPGMVSGYFLMDGDGGLFDEEAVRHLDVVFREPPPAPDHDGLGRLMVRSGATEEYNREVTGLFPGGVRCSVVADCACGTASLSLPQILNALGADVLAVNAQADPGVRSPGPREPSDAREIEEIVSSSPGSIGIRANGIGTAITVIDEHGETLPMDVVFALLVLYLRPASVAVTLDASSVIADAVAGRTGVEVSTPFPERADAVLTMTRDSPAAVCDEVLAGAELGYYHGSVVFSGGGAVGDGIRAAAAVVQMAGDNSLHGLAAALPRYHREGRAYEFPMRPEAFRRAVQELADDLPGACGQYGDAFRVTMDGGWFLIRQTDGCGSIEVLAESRDRAYLIGLLEIADGLVQGVMRSLRSVDDLDVHRLPVGVVGAPAGPVVRLARYEVDAAGVPEEVPVRVRRLVRVPRVRVGGPGEAVVYRRHPLAEEAVGVPVDGAREQDHLRDYAVDLPVHAQELVGIGGPGRLVERVDELYVHAADPHSVFTSLSLTRE